MTPSGPPFGKVVRLLVGGDGEAVPGREPRFGEIAVERGFATRSQIDLALLEQECLRSGGRHTEIGQILLRRGLLSQEHFLEILRILRPDASPEAKIARYEILREIGRGGMGVVYEAHDPELRRRVALKVVRERSGDAKLAERLQREAAVTAQLHHGNIVAVYDVGTWTDPLGERVCYIAMELVEGSTLADLLAERRTPRRELLFLLKQVIEAVRHAHGHRVIHRDLKPSNVLVDSKGRARLTDFGLAVTDLFPTRVTRPQTAIGTPLYMAPEQVQGETAKIDGRTDVYALGIMLYEILVRRPPYLGTTPSRLYRLILYGEPLPPRRLDSSVEPELETLCLTAMAREPEQRYASATALAEDLDRYLNGEPIVARPPSPLARLGRKIAHSRAIKPLLLVALALTVGAGATAAALHRRHVRREGARHRLGAMWVGIHERMREMREGRVPAAQARAALRDSVREVDDYIREWPEDPRGHFVRARGKLYLGLHQEAARELRWVLERRPDFRPGWFLLAVAQMAEVQEAKYEFRRERESKRKLRESLSREAIASLMRGPAAGREQEEWDRWGLFWTREDRILLRLGAFLRKVHVEGAGAEGVRALEEALQEYRSEELAFWLAQNCGDLKRGIEFLSQAITWAPGFAEAYLARGDLRVRTRDYVDAIADLDRVLELKGDCFLAYVKRGVARFESGDTTGAIADYGRALMLNGASAEVYVNRALVRLQIGDLTGALSDYTGAIEAAPEVAEYYYDRGNVRAAAGNYAEATADYDRAIQRKPDLVDAWINRGSAYFKRGLSGMSLDDSNRALEMRPDDLDALCNRGIARHALGDPQGALEDFRTALGLAPPDWPRREGLLRAIRECSN